MSEFKCCVTCSVVLTDQNWPASIRNNGRKLCKACHAAKSARYRNANPGHSKEYYQRTREEQRFKYIEKTYGLTREAFEILMTKQEQKCKICRTLLSRATRKHDSFCIDHDHSTGVVRGILCHSCNVALGHFRDSAALLQNAIVYLNENVISG